MSRLREWLAKLAPLIAWVQKNLRDPVSLDPSNSRTIATAFAVAAIVYGFKHPGEIGTLGIFASAAFGTSATRTKAKGPAADAPEGGAQ